MYELLIEEGYIVIPLAKGTKRPLVKWGQYMLQKPSSELMRSWFARFPGCDVGILTGKHSGVMCLDFDKPPFLTTGFFTRTPSGGRHYFYKYEDHHRHGIGVRDGLDIPHIVKIYARPMVNQGHMPINGTAALYRSRNGAAFVNDDIKPGMSNFSSCDFINFFRTRRDDADWDGRYPLARAYASNVACAGDPDTFLGPDYQHTETIMASLQKPITCRTIVASGYPCQYFDRYSGFCTKNFKSTSPYGLALQQKKLELA